MEARSTVIFELFAISEMVQLQKGKKIDNTFNHERKEIDNRFKVAITTCQMPA